MDGCSHAASPLNREFESALGISAGYHPPQNVGQAPVVKNALAKCP